MEFEAQKEGWPRTSVGRVGVLWDTPSRGWRDFSAEEDTFGGIFNSLQNQYGGTMLKELR